MSEEIEIIFDSEISSYIVRFPDLVKLDSLKKAKKEFERLLESHSGLDRFSLLFDTGAHEFESIECLKYVRTFLSIDILVEKCEKFASVAPENYSKSEVKSEKEAIFNNYADAYKWLSN